MHGKYGKRKGSRCFGLEARQPTQILDILIGDVAEGAARLPCAGTLAGAPCLVDHDAISQGSGQEIEAIAKSGGSGVVVHGNPRKGVSRESDKQCQVSMGSVLNVSF